MNFNCIDVFWVYGVGAPSLNICNRLQMSFQETETFEILSSFQ